MNLKRDDQLKKLADNKLFYISFLRISWSSFLRPAVLSVSSLPSPSPSLPLPFPSSVKDSGFKRFRSSFFLLFVSHFLSVFFWSSADTDIMLTLLRFTHLPFIHSCIYLSRCSAEAGLRSTFNWMDRNDVNSRNSFIRVTMEADVIFLGASRFLALHQYSLAWPQQYVIQYVQKLCLMNKV